VAPLGPGQFTGETSMLAGRRGLVRIRVSEAGVVIELERDQLLALVQTDSELGKCVPDHAFSHVARAINC